MGDYRILVTGSRDWDLPWTVFDALRVIPLLTYSRPIVVHGGAAGADAYADMFARKMGYQVEVHPAAWRANGVYNPQAGLLRNRRMVERGANICLAFIKNGSRGATHCAGLAEEAGIEVRRYTA